MLSKSNHRPIEDIRTKQSGMCRSHVRVFFPGNEFMAHCKNRNTLPSVCFDSLYSDEEKIHHNCKQRRHQKFKKRRSARNEPNHPYNPQQWDHTCLNEMRDTHTAVPEFDEEIGYQWKYQL
jgi:hypothetical protein